MEVTVKAKGVTLAAVTEQVTRDLRTANKTIAGRIGKAGRAAIANGAPRMYGRRLAVKVTNHVTPTSVLVEFDPAKRNAGLWAIAEAGARPHDIAPKRGRVGRNGRPAALRLLADFYAADVAHPGTSGSKAWTKAVDRLDDATQRLIEAGYAEAVGA